MSNTSNDRPVPKQFREDFEDTSRINPFKKRTWTKGVLDLERNAYCGRTPRGWQLILLFYIVFYIAIAVLCTIMSFIYIYPLSDEEPRWYGRQPTFSVSPCDDSNMHYCRIQYKNDYSYYLSENSKFLKKYGKPPGEERFGDCTKENEYGFSDDNPCVFLKINHLIGYQAETYGSAQELPTDAPIDLIEYVKSLSDQQIMGRIWISCIADDENVKFQYFPEERSVLGKLLDIPKKVVYTENTKENKQFYTTRDFERIVAMQMLNLPKDKDIKISCYMYAKNIRIVDENAHGAGKVYLMIKLKS